MPYSSISQGEAAQRNQFASDSDRNSSPPGSARLDRIYDLENIIISKNPQAVEWGRMLFYYFLSGSKKVDLNTYQGERSFLSVWHFIPRKVNI